MNTESQSTIILYALKRGLSITQADAVRLCQCWRLSARIKDLRDAGHQIKTIREKHSNGTHARYVLDMGGAA